MQNWPFSLSRDWDNIKHLGFLWYSVLETVSLPVAKVQAIREKVSFYLDNGGLTADQLRSLLGTLESTRLAVELGPLHYRSLQAQMPRGSGRSWRGRSFISLSPSSRQDLEWWRDNMSSLAVAPLSRGSPNLYLNSDASGSWGWGGHSDRGEYVQDRWDRKQSDLHVNAKEVLAAHKTIDALMRTGDSISIGLDSKTAVAYINKKGGTVSRVLSNLSLALWATVLEKGGWIQAHWIPRGENEVSDMLSKTWIEVWDFGLSPSTVRRIWNRFFIPSMDLFASQRFHLLPLYCSWHVDSNAYARDAFSIPWPGRAFAFLPAPPPRSYSAEDPTGQDHSYSDGSELDDLTVVAEHGGDDGGGPAHPGLLQESANRDRGDEVTIPGDAHGLSGEGGELDFPLSSEAQDLLDNDVRKSTKKVYKSRMDTFSAHCRDLGVDPTSCPVSVVVNLLSILRRVCGYECQTICIYRSSSLAALGPTFHRSRDEVIIPVLSLEKASRPSAIHGEICCPLSPPNSKLSIQECLKNYLAR